jgi:hypothetical protein
MTKRLKKRASRRSPLEAAAHHEAGHAVIAICLEQPFSLVSIDKNDYSRGRVDIRLDRRRRDWVELACITALAGPFAQRRYNPRSRWRYGGTGAGAGDRFMMKGADFQIVSRLIADFKHDDDKVGRAYYRYLEAQAEAPVDDRWSDIEAVAHALLAQGTMSRDEMRQTIFESRVRPSLQGTQHEAERRARRPH